MRSNALALKVITVVVVVIVVVVELVVIVIVVVVIIVVVAVVVVVAVLEFEDRLSNMLSKHQLLEMSANMFSFQWFKSSFFENINRRVIQNLIKVDDDQE